MSYYANYRFDDGERIAVEIGTVKGWSDFCKWARSLPAKFKLLHRLADKGTCAGPRALYHEIHAAAKVSPPGPSAKAVANKILAWIAHPVLEKRASRCS